jgi:predicted small lipoprotein YifL
MKKIAAILLASLCAIALNACASRGPLTLPPGPAPEPLFGNPKPVKPAPKNPSPADVSTAPNERPQ